MGSARTTFIVVAGVIVSVIISIIVLWNIPTTNNIPSSAKNFYIVRPKTPQSEQKTVLDIAALTQYAVQKINEDRRKFDLSPVVLNLNRAAQIDAEDLLKTKDHHPSHWSTDGMKPYMGYSLYGGNGYVEQNVAAGGYDNTTIYKC
jgi:uncharacterized protein YkwD